MSNNHHVHVARPDGSFVANVGEFAGQRVVVLGGNRIRGGDQVTLTSYSEPIPAYFDPAGKPKPMRPDLLPTPTDNKDAVKARPDVVEVPMEQFTMSKPTEANPFADLQIVVDDDDDIVAAEVIESSESIDEDELTPDEFVEVLLERDLRTAKLSPEDFNKLCMSKKQLWHLHEQVVGRTVNKPTPTQGIANIIKNANSSGANFRRVVDAIKRVRERIQ